MNRISFDKFAKYSLVVLVFNLAVILWGAYVRATGSGAGCGSHWPDCRGEIIPANPQIETLIEFTHRLSSGVAFVLVLIMVVIAWKIYPKGNPVRVGSGLSMFFMITEALVGATLVRFQWVAYDVSLGRVITISIHLINTLLLLASITLTIWWASVGKKIIVQGHKLAAIALILAILSMLIIGVTGAITALGDTLFPAESLAEGIQQDFSPTAHFLLRLRVWHPVIAIISGLYIIFIAFMLNRPEDDKLMRFFSTALVGLIVVQLVAGFINLLLLAPIPMQLVHLLLADLVWILLILFTLTKLSLWV
jgi:heme A synthase